jgi:precorrin-2 dehydrogenase/sirohydrochlorin ferrochelatase
MLPLYHDFRERSVVIVGGGPVALRKARTFATEADVTVVAPSFVDGFADVPCERERRAVAPEEASAVVEDSFLVVPATDDRAVNDALAIAGRKAGCLVNRTDERGRTVTPSRIETDRLSVAVSTAGASPAMAKYLRREIEPLLARADPMTELQAELRRDLRDGDRSARERRDALWRVIEDEGVWNLLDDDRYGAAKARAEALVRDGNDGSDGDDYEIQT